MINSSWPSTIEPRPGSAGWKRQHAEVEAALGHFCAQSTGRDPSDVDVHEGVGSAECRNEVEHRVHRGFVGPDEHPATPQVAEFADRGLGLLRQPEHALRILLQELPGVGQSGVLGGPVEQPFPKAFLEPADGLTDGRLCAVKLHRGP